MLELRRSRSQQSEGSPLMGSLHEIDIDVSGISGITVDRGLLSSSDSSKKNNTGIAPPEKMKAVVAVFCNGEFCASSGLSHHLRNAPSSQSSKNSKSENESLIALWGKRSRISKIKFDVLLDESTSPSDPVVFDLWVALTDGKGENKTCVSYPIGVANLLVDGASSKALSMDLPISGIALKKSAGDIGKKSESSDSSDLGRTEEKKVDEGQQTSKPDEPTVAMFYGLQNFGGAVLRLKVECKRKKQTKKERKKSSVSKLSELKEDYCTSDDEGSKTFRPIETSSLASESAYSLGDIVSSRLPAKTLKKDRADLGFGVMDFGGIDESQEMDFSLSVGSRFSLDRTAPPYLENGPKSAFTAISPISKTTTPTICSTVSNANNESQEKQGQSLVNLLESPGNRNSPLDLGTLDPNQEEPSELGDSLRLGLFRQMPTDEIPVALLDQTDDEDSPDLDSSIHKPYALDITDQLKRTSNSLSVSQYVTDTGQVPMVIRTVSQVQGNRTTFPRPPRARPRESEGNMIRPADPLAMKQDQATAPYVSSCGVFGSLLQIPMAMMMQEEVLEEQVLRDFQDDHTWSTIETSSQVAAWHDSVRAYAAETSSMASINEHKEAPGFCGTGTAHVVQCGPSTKSSSQRPAAQQKGDNFGFWNDMPSSGNGCL